MSPQDLHDRIAPSESESSTGTVLDRSVSQAISRTAEKALKHKVGDRAARAQQQISRVYVSGSRVQVSHEEGLPVLCVLPTLL